MAGCRKRFVAARRTATWCSSQRWANSSLACRGHRSQAGHLLAGALGAVLGWEQFLGRRVQEEAADHVASRGREGEDVAAQRPRQRVLGQDLAAVGRHHGRGVVQPVQHQEQSRAHVRAGRLPARRLFTGEVEEVVAFVLRQAQGAGQRGEHLAGRARAPGLFQPRVVVRGHAGQLGHLLAA